MSSYNISGNGQTKPEYGFITTWENINAQITIDENKNKSQNRDEQILKEVILDCKVESFTDINKRFFLRKDVRNPEFMDRYININFSEKYVISNFYVFKSYDKVFKGEDKKKNFYLEMDSYDKNIILIAVKGYNVNIPLNNGTRQRSFFEIDRYDLKMTVQSVEVVRDETQFNNFKFGQVLETSYYQCQNRNKKNI